MTKKNSTLPDTIPDKPSEDLLIENLYAGQNKYQAAINAGYSKNSAKVYVYQKMKSQRFRDKVLARGYDLLLLDLPPTVNVLHRVVKHLDSDSGVADFPKYKDAPKWILQMVGLMQSDSGVVKNTQNIHLVSIQQLVTGQMKTQNGYEVDDDVIDITENDLCFPQIEDSKLSDPQAEE
jgi:hypothetical protein